MKRILSIVLAISLTVAPTPARATGVPVVDVAAIAQLLEQVKNTLAMIEQLKNMYGKLRSLKDFADLDHENLANQHFLQFFERYTSEFERIFEQIEGYQNMFSQIGRLDEVYSPYHTDWEEQVGSGPNGELTPLDEQERILKKQILWTRIQMKHAAKVGAVVRETLKDGQQDLETLMKDNSEAAGMLLAAQIGNELTGVVGKNLQTLNTQMNEFIQAYTAQNLEQNQTRGRMMNRIDEVLKGLGELRRATPVPLNPIGAF
jgi:P-type conjugative transfer protein TrbJ